PRWYSRPPSRPGHSSSSRTTTSGFRAGRARSSGSRAAGSKKYSAACVATTLTRCPACFSASYSAGVRMAATEPVTPSRTLAMRLLLVQPLDGLRHAHRQLAAADVLVAPLDRPEQGPLPGLLQRVGHHQVSG